MIVFISGRYTQDTRMKTGRTHSGVNRCSEHMGGTLLRSTSTSQFFNVRNPDQSPEVLSAASGSQQD